MESKLEKLKNNLKKMEKVAVAFSGGLDSSFLSKIAYDTLKENAIAITINSPVFPVWEIEEAKKIAKEIGIQQIIVDFDHNAINGFSKNSVERCYICKKKLYSMLIEIGKKNAYRIILDGSTSDDQYDYRPGKKALKELKIVSPLRDVDLNKKEIRHISKDMGLSTWNKPSFACLASRFPYGTAITKLRLERIEKAEDFIRKLDVKQFRVRYHDELARIEVLKEDFDIILKNSEKIFSYLKELGFKYVTLDIEGYRSGSLNEVLDL
jgi:uncharacterized protein